MIEQDSGMSLIVKTVTRLTVGLILLYGIYIVLHGHVSPGGGFAGGVIIALAFAHLTLAFGKKAALHRLPEGSFARLESLGAVAFLAIALAGFVPGEKTVAGWFFRNSLPRGEPGSLLSGGIILPCNLAICCKVGAGLFAIFLALILLKPESEED